MLDVILKILVWLIGWLGWLIGWLGWLIAWLRPPIGFEIVEFYPQDLRNKFIISAYPRRYYAKLAVTNRTHKVVYVKSIVLSGPHGKLRKEATLREPLRLEPGEPKEEPVIFPFNDGEVPVTGRFEIEVIPSIGRKAVRSVIL